MAGTKGRSGPPGHTKRLSGGWHYLQKHGKPPKERRHVSKYMEAVRHNLLEVLGGVERATPQAVLLIDATVLTAGIVALMWEHLAKEGAFLGPSNEVQPCLKTMGTYLNTLRLNLCSLGIDKRAGEEILDIPTHIKENYPVQVEGKDDTK